jgi:hypothetical protein
MLSVSCEQMNGVPTHQGMPSLDYEGKDHRGSKFYEYFAQYF